MIDVKLNKELQDYHESVLFGLSLRQTVCSVLAIGTAVGLHFLLAPYLHTEFVSAGGCAECKREATCKVCKV